MAEDTLECRRFRQQRLLFRDRRPRHRSFADPKHARALLADPHYAFKIVAKTLGAPAINRVSTHSREKLALAGHTEVAIADPHDPAAGVRLANDTDIAAAAPLNTDAIRIVDRNDCCVIGTVTDCIYRLGVLAFRCDSGIVTALSEDSMETLAGSYDASRGFAIAVNAMPTVANAPNSEAPTAGAFTFDAGYFLSGDVADIGFPICISPFELML